MSTEIPTLNPLSLSGAQRRHLRGLGHHLKPLVQIGQNGLTAGVIEATKAVLERHELVKISVGSDAPVDRKIVPGELGAATGAHVAQVIGRTALLYRRHPEEPQISLPGQIDLPRKVPEA